MSECGLCSFWVLYRFIFCLVLCLSIVRLRNDARDATRRHIATRRRFRRSFGTHSRMASSSYYVGAIDQGTTSTRFIVYECVKDECAADSAATTLRVVGSHQLEHAQRYPKPGWCEHDAMEIFTRVCECAQGALARAGVTADALTCVGITNQRETTVAWRRSDGTPLANAVVWLDTRTRDVCDDVTREVCGGDKRALAPVCGLPVSTYFSGMKMRWLLENEPKVREAADAGNLCFGTIESWLVFKLTDGKVHATDVTNASRTMLMRLDDLTWDAPTCQALGIPTNALPEIKSCAEDYGIVDGSIPALAGVRITGCIGDQQSATLGQLCGEGEAKNTYGTGCFMVLNTGTTIVPSTNGLLTTMAWQLGGRDKPAKYALEGSVAIGGAVVHWLRDNLGLITKASEIEDLASTVDDAAGVSFVPAFNGLFAPRWREDARGVIVGLTQYVNKGHIARAALEAIAFQSRDVLEAMRQDIAQSTSHSLNVLKVDGGASANNLLMQIQAECLGMDVVRPADIETTARGAAYAAAIGAGMMTEDELFASASASNAAVGEEHFTPRTSAEERVSNYARWNDAIERTLNIAK